MADPLADFARVDGLLGAALDRPPEARAAFLDGACVDADGVPDPALRARLGRLVAAAEDASADPAAPARALAAALATDPDRADAEAAPVPLASVGPWRIAGLLGRGGTGAVYLGGRDLGGAVQRAAVKRLRADLDAPLAHARFLQERAVLAGLDHPHIARLLDGGETADGQPYLATEVVAGEPITDYCDRRGLGVEARVRLLLQVCDAVSYAHRRLVVHRDLKPSNVLAADGPEGDPQAKLLDFGIAKLLEAGPAEAMTAPGLSPMTPGYAAPEVLTEGEVTVGADVYGLGVLLFELLTGRRPFESAAGAGSSVPEGVAALTDAPSRPSTTVARRGEGVGPSAPGVLARRLRGDLDVICLRAIARDPARRYASAGDLAADLRRHLDGRPVEARPDTWGYRLSRFARRHRVAAVATVLGTLALVVGLGAALLALGRERTARAEAERSATRAEVTAGFLVELFEAADPVRADGAPVSARDVLDRGRRRVEGLRGQPALQGQLLTAMGRTYRSAGDLAAADSLLRAGLARTAAARGPSHPETARARVALGASRLALADADGALALYAAARRDLRRTLDDDDPEVADADEGVASALVALDRADEAEALFARLAAAHRARGDDDRLARALLGVGYARQAAGRDEEALEPLRQAYALRRRVSGPDHARTVAVAVTLGAALGELDRLDEAERMFRAALDGDRHVYGPRHPYVADDLANLGSLLVAAGRPRAARAALREAREIYQETLPPGHPDLAWTDSMLARVGGP